MSVCIVEIVSDREVMSSEFYSKVDALSSNALSASL